MILRYAAGATEAEGPQRSLRTAFARLWVERGGDSARALRELRERRPQPVAAPDVPRGDPLEDLVRDGLLRETDGRIEPGPRLMAAVRETALEFARIDPGEARAARPRFARPSAVPPQELPWSRPFAAGDDPRSVDWAATLRNVRARGARPESLRAADLEVRETEEVADGAVVVLIDASGSMTGSGEDRLTPAKLAAIGLAEHLRRTRPLDALDVVAFGERAWRIPVEELPALEAGPSDTNTAEGLRLSREILARRGAASRSIALITDGKPTCAWDGRTMRRRPGGGDPRVAELTIAEGRRCARDGVRISTFLVADDPPLEEFVERFARAVGGRAYRSELDRLGGFVLRDWEARRGS